jgi:hypothetical protein
MKDEKVEVPNEPVKAVEQGPDTDPADVQKEVTTANPGRDAKPHNLVKKAGEVGVTSSPSETASK